MFILTNIDTDQDLVQVYDTEDGTNDVVRLSVAARNVRSRGLKIYGLGRLGGKLRPTSTPLTALGVYVDVTESKEAFATYFQKTGMSREQARAKAGLVT